METLFPGTHWTNLLIIPGLLIGYTVHELAHAFVAYFLGDYSQVERGKITLNPFRHVSWFGAFAFILAGWWGFVLFSVFGGLIFFVTGWPNFIEVNPQNLKRKHISMSLIAISGPVASLTLSLAGLLLTLCVAAALVYGSGVTTDKVFLLLFPTATDLPQALNLQAWLMAFTSYIAIASFGLAFANLLPVPGQDGFAFMVSFVAFLRGREEDNHNQTERPDPAAPPKLRPLINQYERRNNVSDIHFKLGAEYHEAQKYDDAIARYRQALNADQHFGPAYVNLGLAYVAKGKRREAIHAFRGAVQYADDQKSQNEAWFQLHQLSEVSPVDEEAAQESMTEIGASPWTDTKPRPNWLALSVGGVFLLIAGIFLYSYLIASFIEMLKA